MNFFKKVIALTNRITLSILDKTFAIIVAKDTINNKRVYIQLEYSAKCTKTGEVDNWKGRKWYLSEYMTDDEIVKTCYAAFEAAVKHEILEGFKVDGKILFNPHINFEELLKVSNKEVKREYKSLISTDRITCLNYMTEICDTPCKTCVY